MASTVQEQHDELQGSSNSENASLKGPSVDSTGLVDDAADLNNAGESQRWEGRQLGVGIFGRHRRFVSAAQLVFVLQRRSAVGFHTECSEWHSCSVWGLLPAKYTSQVPCWLPPDPGSANGHGLS